MNKGEIVRDENNDVYLKVTGKPIDEEEPVYFLIQPMNSEPEGKLTLLSKGLLLIDLSGKK